MRLYVSFFIILQANLKNNEKNNKTGISMYLEKAQKRKQLTKKKKRRKHIFFCCFMFQNVYVSMRVVNTVQQLMVLIQRQTFDSMTKVSHEEDI